MVALWRGKYETALQELQAGETLDYAAKFHEQKVLCMRSLCFVALSRPCVIRTAQLWDCADAGRRAQEENARLRGELVHAGMERVLLCQDVQDLERAMESFRGPRASCACQTEPSGVQECAAQTDGVLGSIAVPAGAQRSPRPLGVTRITAEMAPEGVAAASADTSILRAVLATQARPLLCSHSVARTRPTHSVPKRLWLWAQHTVRLPCRRRATALFVPSLQLRPKWCHSARLPPFKSSARACNQWQGPHRQCSCAQAQPPRRSRTRHLRCCCRARSLPRSCRPCRPRWAHTQRLPFRTTPRHSMRPARARPRQVQRRPRKRGYRRRMPRRPRARSRRSMQRGTLTSRCGTLWRCRAPRSGCQRTSMPALQSPRARRRRSRHGQRRPSPVPPPTPTKTRLSLRTCPRCRRPRRRRRGASHPSRHPQSHLSWRTRPWRAPCLRWRPSRFPPTRAPRRFTCWKGMLATRRQATAALQPLAWLMWALRHSSFQTRSSRSRLAPQQLPTERWRDLAAFARKARLQAPLSVHSR